MDDKTVGMEVDPEIAAAMGFASFGSSKGPSKFGRGEAVTENWRPKHSRPTDFGTDANRVELGPRKRQADLDESAVQGISENRKPSCFTNMTSGADMTDLGPRKRRAEHHEVDPSTTAYTSDVPTESRHTETVTAQSDVKATTPSPEDLPRQSEQVVEIQSSTPAKSSKKKKETIPTGLAAFLARGKGLPEKPPTACSNTPPYSTEAGGPTASLSEAFDAQSVSTNIGPDLQAFRNGIRNENGDIAYFLPSFIEDPWAHLEK